MNGSKIEYAKRKAVGGRRKKCTKGKSCSATCIAANKVCLVEVPWVSANNLSRVASMVGNLESAPKMNFSGRNLIVGNETFVPGKTLPGSTSPTLYKDKEGNGKWVVKEGGAPGQNSAEKAANDVYGILSKRLGSGGVESNLVNGKLVNKFVEGGRTLDSLSNQDMIRLGISDKIRKSHMADALVANWDYIGLVRDNMMVDKTGRLLRIDSGGTFNFRAQGGDKNYSPLPMEVWVLRARQGKPFWDGAKDSDYRDLWVRQAGAIASEGKSLKAALGSSTLPQGVKQSFGRRVEAMGLANRAVTSQTFNNKTISQFVENGAMSWKDVDGALEKAFKTASSFDANSRDWSEKVKQQISKELGSLVGA